MNFTFSNIFFLFFTFIFWHLLPLEIVPTLFSKNKKIGKINELQSEKGLFLQFKGSFRLKILNESLRYSKR